MLFPHIDISFFSILYQDNEGGLQIHSKQGEWLNVKPLPNSFVVNVGDTLKVWSNSRYNSGEHRVVYKGWKKNRLSLPFFVQFPEDKPI
ncbi:hypothetical protein SUGI_0868990 [Cryptomeria japonica]|nr:hypothetical protein SUGI_0868990 [Cryptomeria japonica]